MTGINIFKNAPDAEDVKQGDVLFREGETGDVMFAVVEGEVELTRGDRVVDSVGAGGIIGEMALVDTEPRSATATVKSPTRRARRPTTLHVLGARASDVRAPSHEDHGGAPSPRQHQRRHLTPLDASRPGGPLRIHPGRIHVAYRVTAAPCPFTRAQRSTPPTTIRCRGCCGRAPCTCSSCHLSFR